MDEGFDLLWIFKVFAIHVFQGPARALMADLSGEFVIAWLMQNRLVFFVYSNHL